jgi:hypothetical protein
LGRAIFVIAAKELDKTKTLFRFSKRFQRYYDMRDRLQLEAWASEIVQSVGRKQIQEDDRIEFKSTWPSDHNRMARRIAGMANAAGGHEIILLIGVDPKGEPPITDPGTEDLSEWLPAIRKQFAENNFPSEIVCQPTFEDYRCVAIIFDSSNAPFLVKNPNFGTAGHTIEFEVPWRAGTSVRTARRSEILSLMRRHAHRPDFEVLHFQANAGHDFVGDAHLSFFVTLYAIADETNSIVLPFHRISWKVDYGQGDEEIQSETVKYFSQDESVSLTNSSILIASQGLFQVSVNLPIGPDALESIKTARLQGILQAGIERTAILIDEESSVSRN